ncbi:MAG: phosphatase PAP2 family protein [Treponema sp.]|jgi:undecaprenyl-diphosphatase|nr:phosphatase PAP2 family protein [Treponema sp.]
MEKKLPVTGICLTAAGGLLGFIVKTRPGLLAPLDGFLTGILRDALYPGLNPFFTAVTKLGDFGVVLVIAVLAAAALLGFKKRREAVWLSAGMAVVPGVLVPLLKGVVGRGRPDLPRLVAVHDMSFPSGHGAAAMVLYGTLVVLAGLYGEKRGAVRVCQVCLVTLILAVGISRVYCGVHFPTDVIGGFLLGAGWLGLTRRLFVPGRAGVPRGGAE